MLPRWVKVGVIVAAVLAAVGYYAKPYAKDWWLAREACGGAVPDEAVEKLIPGDEHLTADYEYVSKEMGAYTCRLSYGDGGITSVAYTDRDSQDLMISSTFYDGTGRSFGSLPDGLPGYGDNSRVHLMQTCPDLGKDAAGRPQRLLVRTSAGWEAMEDEPDTLLRTAVALTNEASRKLGCGAEPLKAPAARALPEEPEPVALSKAAGTPCSWLSGAKLPQGAEWTVGIAANDAAPVSRCELYRDGDDYPGLRFNAWYGDWSEVPFKEAAGSHGNFAADGWKTGPLLTAEWGRAKASCDTETANFEAAAGDEAGIRGPQLRALLTAFAQDQVKRHGCTGLALPGRELPVSKR